MRTKNRGQIFYALKDLATAIHARGACSSLIVITVAIIAKNPLFQAGEIRIQQIEGRKSPVIVEFALHGVPGLP